MPGTVFIAAYKSFELNWSIAALVLGTVRVMASRPERVKVESHFDQCAITLMLSVHPDDISKIVGKDGSTTRSLRDLMSAISRKTGVHVKLDTQAERVLTIVSGASAAANNAIHLIK